MYAYRVAYDGRAYRGFQRQPHGETIEDELFRGLDRLGVDFDDGAPAGYSAAGRTDAGVSARAQTIAFEAPEWLTPRAFDSELPGDVRAWARADVPANFDATLDATRRVYRYVLVAPDDEVDDALATTACRRLSGTHDVHNLTPDDDRTDRKLSVSCRREGEPLVIDCRSGGFSRQLVRRIVSVVESVATESREPAFLDRILSAERLSGPDGVSPAPPEPLVLFSVTYPDVEFHPDEVALEGTREFFEARRREQVASTRIVELLSEPDR